jgi:hypothetical protein
MSELSSYFSFLCIDLVFIWASYSPAGAIPKISRDTGLIGSHSGNSSLDEAMSDGFRLPTLHFFIPFEFEFLGTTVLRSSDLRAGLSNSLIAG